MDGVRLINKALSDADTQRILGGDAEITEHAELGNLYDIDQLLPGEKGYCFKLYEDKPRRRNWTAPSKKTTVTTSTLTPTASSQIVS